MEIYEMTHVLIFDSSKLAIRLRARFCYEKTVNKETLKNSESSLASKFS